MKLATLHPMDRLILEELAREFKRQVMLELLPPLTGEQLTQIKTKELAR